MDQLGMLKGLGGLGALGDIDGTEETMTRKGKIGEDQQGW